MRRLSLLVLLAACDGGEVGDGPRDEAPVETDPAPVDSDAPPADSDAPPDTDAPADSDPAPTTCADGLAPGDHALTLQHDGARRRYLLHVPPADDDAPRPLVLSFHGYLFDAEDQRSRTRMNATADRHGFLVAYPDGTSRSWNGGACCGTAASSGVDDVGFAKAVVAHVAERACVDAERVYATGFSNGGFLSHRLACRAGDTFAAIASVAGMMTIDPDTCDAASPVPVLHLHGTLDPVVPYGGSSVWDYPSFDRSNRTWTTLHGCTGEPAEDGPRGVTCKTWDACATGATVRACTYDGLLHTWPGGGSALPANEEIWGFFQRFTRSSP